MTIESDLEKLESSAGFRRLPERALEIGGPDAMTWLQGQFTNDVHKLDEHDSVYGFVVGVRGKIVSDGRVTQGPYLWVEPSALQSLQARLERFIVMEDVVLKRSNLELVSVQGPRAEALSSALSTPWVRSDRLGRGGIDLLVPPDRIASTLEELAHVCDSVGGGAVGEAAWERARVRKGRPRYGADFDGSNYPQETGLTEQTISFSKGCYVGQEVICTLQSRGQLVRRLVRLEAPLPAEIGPGSVLWVGDKEAGKVTSWSSADGIGLGYVRRIHLDAGQARTHEGLELTIIPPSGT